MLLPSDDDDMFDDMMSSDEEEDDISDDDYDEPSFGSDEDDYSAGCLSTIWEEETHHENDTVTNAEVDMSNRSALQTLHTSQNCGDDSFLNDSANRDLWKSISSAIAGDDFSFDALDSSLRKEPRPTKRWSSEMSLGSLSTSGRTSSSDSGCLNNGKDETPKASHRKSLGAQSQSDTSLNSSSNNDSLGENDLSPISAAAPENTSKQSKERPQKKPKSWMETGDVLSDALLAQMVAAYLTDGAKADVGTQRRRQQQQQQSNFNSRLSLDSFLAASQPRTGRRNQAPGKPRRTSSPTRRRSADSMSSAGESGISGDSLMERLRTRPNANAFNADENVAKNDTPPVLTRTRQDVRRRPPGMPVRQSSLISIGVEEDSDEDNEDSIHEDDDDESSSRASRPSFSRHDLVKRSSFMSNSSADMTIEEGDEDEISSDDETLDSDAEESIPQIAPRQYLAPLKGGRDTDSIDDSDLEEEEETEKLPSRQYLSPLKGGAAEDMSLRDYVVSSRGYYEEEGKECLLPLKGSQVKEDSRLVDDTNQDENAETEGPTAQKGLNHALPEITTIKLPQDDERVDAKLVLEKHLLEEQRPKSPGTLARRRGSGQKRKIKYAMARSAIAPKIDHLVAPACKKAPVTYPSVEKSKSNTHPLSLSNGTKGVPPRAPVPPQPSTQLQQQVEQPEESMLDPQLSPLNKSRKASASRRNTDDKRIRIRSKMQQVESRLTKIRNILSESGPNEDQDIEYEKQSSSTQLTESSAYLTDGSSEMDLSIQMGSTHSAHSSRSRSRHMSMAGMVDEADRVPGPPIRSPRSPISPLQHPTPCEPTILETDGDSGSVSSHSGRKARTAIKIGFKRSKKRLQSLFRPHANTDSSKESEEPTPLSVQ